MTRSARREPSKFFNHLVLSLLTAFAIAPILVLGFNSLKSRAEIGENPLGFPRAIQLENFPNAWQQGKFATTMRNSVLFVIGTVTSVLVLGGLAAYSLARLKPPGADGFMLYMLVAATIPVWLYLVPLFTLWRTLGLLNNPLGLIMIYTALNAPFAIFLLRTFLLAIPRELEDAALVDGANRFQTLLRIILPLSWSGFLTVGLVVALGVWGEFQIALIFVHDPNLFPVTTSYFAFVNRFGRDWALTSAAAVMMIAPVIIFFLALQRRFIEGLTQGSVKT
jgi:raffinose/stachyose/melibiose transport system permease protein